MATTQPATVFGSARPGHILVADDRRDNRELLAQALGDRYRVTLAEGGEQAIACIAGDRPDLIILDLLMPGVDGFAVLTHLAECPGPFLPVIVVSAVTEQVSRVQALQQGAHEFLSRPFDLEELTVRMQTMLALKAARLNLEAAVAGRTAELRLANEELKQADRYKDEFLSVVSHELRTPLTSIMGFASILEDGMVGDLTEPQAAVTAEILVGTNRMLGLVNNLLDMSLLSAGKLVLMPIQVHYAVLVAQVIDALQPLAAARGVDLGLEVDVDVEAYVDAERIVQVLTHLIGNALKFTNAGGHVTIRAYQSSDRLVTEVVDSGVGIPVEAQERVFKRLQQVDMSTTRTYGGAGLGLALAKGIVEAHGGLIGLRSIPGVGSTFWFDLPVTAARPQVTVARA